MVASGNRDRRGPVSRWLFWTPRATRRVPYGPSGKTSGRERQPGHPADDCDGVVRKVLRGHESGSLSQARSPPWSSPILVLRPGGLPMREGRVEPSSRGPAPGEDRDLVRSRPLVAVVGAEWFTAGLSGGTPSASTNWAGAKRHRTRRLGRAREPLPAAVGRRRKTRHDPPRGMMRDLG